MLQRGIRLFRSVNRKQSICQQRPLCVTAHLRTREKDATEDNVDISPTKRKRGRPRKDEPVSIVADTKNPAKDASTIKASAESSESKTRRSRNRTSKPSKLPPRLMQPSRDHHDLASFLAYADRVKLKDSTVYKGTLYEYTVASVLSNFNFTLHRTGRANDLGIDLVGHFNLPSAVAKPRSRKENLQELRVLVQCKALKPTPAMVRELEGAYVGAPAGWGGGDVLALLVASKEATKGMRDALQRSRWPMGLMQVTPEGDVRQFLWNAVAADIGLAGLGVTVKYADASNANSGDGNEAKDGGKGNGSLALTWMGRMWRSSDAVE